MKANKITKAFSIVIMFILLCTFAFLPFPNKTKEKVLADAVSNSLYAFVSTQNNKPVNGRIYVDFGISLDYEIQDKEENVINEEGEINRLDADCMVDNEVVPFESAKIYLRTRNMSAITEAGDYEAIDQTFTVFGDSPCANIAVKVNNVGLQLNGVAHQFYVEIYKVEITGVKENYTLLEPSKMENAKKAKAVQDIRTEILSTGAEFTMGTISKNGLYQLDLDSRGRHIPQNTCQDVTETRSFNDVKVDLANFDNGWYNKLKYLSDHDMVKLGIRLSGAAYEAQNGSYVDNSFVGIQIFAGDSKNVGAPDLEDVPAQNIFTDPSTTELARWFIKFQSDEREVWGLKEAFNGYFCGVDVAMQFNENVFIPDNSEGKRFGEGGYYDGYVGTMDHSRENTFVVDDLNAVLNRSTTISARFWSYYSGKTKYYDGDLNFIPTNYRAKVESATLGQLFKDESGKRKIGVSLRFNEPLQFKDKTGLPSIKGKLNNFTELTFEYKAGEGTDTLYFEAYIPEGYNTIVSDVILTSADGFTEVYDFAPKATTGGVLANGATVGVSQTLNVMTDKGVNGWEPLPKILTCHYDLQKPIVDVEKRNSTTAKTSHTVTVRTEKIEQTGKLYYGWSTGDGVLPQSLSVAPISAQGYQTIYSPANITGERYLYVYAVSELDEESDGQRWYGPYYFDNEAPTFVNLENSLTQNLPAQKQFSITVQNNSLDGFKEYANLKEVKLLVSSDPKGETIVKRVDLLGINDDLHSETLKLAPYDLKPDTDGSGFVLQPNSSNTFYVFFSVSDTLGNQTITTPKAYNFDSREVFTVSLSSSNLEMDEFKADSNGKSPLGDNYYTIDLSKMEEGKDAYFILKADRASISEDEELTSSVALEKFVKVYEEEGKEKEAPLSSDVYVAAPNGLSLTITIQNQFEPGLYRLILSYTTEKRSLPIYFYVTNGKLGDGADKAYQEETGGYYAIFNNAVLTNEAFQLPATLSYYYMTDKGAVEKASYTDGNGEAIFSSWEVARDYIRYLEQLDFYAVTLTADMARALNSTVSVSNYRKAEGVKESAREGQVWIRYKDPNWRPNSSTSDWVYYYYGEDASSLPLQEDKYSQLLTNALNNITNAIAAEGGELDLVTGDYLDKYGAPSVNPKQLHLAPMSSIESNYGTPFANAVQYLGDPGMYVSFDPETNSSLATNVKVPFAAHRRIYYKNIASQNASYELLTNDSGSTFWECIKAEGIFAVLELDENGACEYFIKIDKTAPTLKISWEKDGKIDDPTSYGAKDNGGEISGNRCYITGIEDGDTLSFVAIYRYTQKGEGDLLYVFRNSDLKNSFSVPNGKYYVQASDRSGNSYTFVLQLKAESLTFEVTEVKNAYIRLEGLNREENEILSYRVLLDGQFLTSDLSEKKFTEKGTYEFIIKDIYGNEETKVHYFEREDPTVQWSYKASDGGYVNYQKDNARIKIEGEGRNFEISTSTSLRFKMLDGCTYEIISGTPWDSKNPSTGWVTLNNIAPFTMKVYYEAHPDNYVMYTCRVDTSAPQISVSYVKGYYQGFDLEEIANLLKEGAFPEKGIEYAFTPERIGFYLNEKNAPTMYVMNGQSVQSKYFKVQISDESEIESVNVYWKASNDSKETLLSEIFDFNNIYLSRRGTYRIVAMDKFGNENTFTFTNALETRVEYFVDGEELSTDVSFVDKFDKNDKTYTKEEYGNTQTTIKLLADVEVQYLITVNGETYHFGFIVENGALYRLSYAVKIGEGEDDLLDKDGNPIFDAEGKPVKVSEVESVSKRGEKALSVGEIAKIQLNEKSYIAITLSKNQNGQFLLTVHSNDDTAKAYTVETRVSVPNATNEMPYYFKTRISTVPSAVQFFDGDNDELDSSKTMRVNDSFKIVVSDSDIESVQIASSQEGIYTEYKPYDGKERGDAGMYHIKALNKFGIQTDYYVVISKGFDMSAIVNYTGGMTLTYDYDSTKTREEFYSNVSVKFIVPTINCTVDCVLLEGGGEVEVTDTEQGYKSIYIDKQGAYELTVKDEYGNVIIKKIYIKAQTFTVGENVLTGFNQKPSGNYTNQKLVFNQAAFEESKIAFISMYYGDTAITVYDAISQNQPTFDETQHVGVLKDGAYKVVFRDLYGNKAELTVHYCETPTLKIMRKTLNGVNAEEYSLEKALSDGVWTNDSVSFVISAKEYYLTVDGMQNVYSISYENKTKNTYEVRYEDEYGFAYTFCVHLRRADVEIAPAEGMAVTQISDLLVTKDGVQMSFTQDAACTYVFNNEPEREYQSGDVLYKDGIYHFKVVDKAGNVSTYTVKKDSAVEYRLEGAGAGEVLFNGGVTNGNTVKFFSENSDSAYIKKVFHNNAFIEYEDEIFTERGKWELIVADEVGNESYFRFYILYGKIDGLTYSAPYDYKINSVLRETEESYLNVTEAVLVDGRLEAKDNGTYTVTMECLLTAEITTFTFTVDKTAPKVQLVGCQQNEKTINDITLSGCAVGDTIYVYKDGELIKTVRIASDYMDPPVINEAGKYRIVVENEAGVKTELSFERRYVPNVAGSVLIIVLALAAVVGLMVGLVWRNHSKTDD